MRALARGFLVAGVWFASFTAVAAEDRLMLSTDAEGDTFLKDEPAVLQVHLAPAEGDAVGRFLLEVRDVAADKVVQEDIIAVDPPVTPGSSRTIPVALTTVEAGTYRVTVKTDDAAAGLTVARLLGDDPPVPAGPVPYFGFCCHKYAPEHFKLYPRYGGRVKRDVFGWRSTHVGEGLFDWRTADERVGWLTDAGVAPLLLLCYTPPWASRQPDAERPHKTPPIDIRHYQEYVQAVARRYATRIRLFEVWNEPNIAFLDGTAEEYADLQKAAFVTLRNHTTNATVAMAGTAGIDFHYLDRLADNGVFNYSDTVTVHTYTWGPPERLVPQLKALREWRDRRAPGLQIWSSEWGHKCAAEGGPEPRTQASYVARQIIIQKAYDLAHSSYYVWLWAPHKIMNGNRSPKPAAVAYRTCAQFLTNARVVGALMEDDDGRYAYVFECDGHLIVAAWATRETDSNLTVPVAADAQLVDMRGRATDLPEGEARIALDTMPLFVTRLKRHARDDLKLIQRDDRTRPAAVAPQTWLRFHYPRGSTCLPCPRNAGTSVRLMVRHDGNTPATVRLIPAVTAGFDVNPPVSVITIPPRSETAVEFAVKVPETLADGRHQIQFNGEVDGQPCGTVTASLWVSDRVVKEFTCNQYEERLHRTAGKNTGASTGIVWTHGEDGFIEWRFDLSAFRSAELTMDCGAHLGKTFAVIARGRDDQPWQTLYEGAGEDRERTYDVSAFCGDNLHVRLLDKAEQSPSGARVRQFRLYGQPVNQ